MTQTMKEMADQARDQARADYERRLARGLEVLNHAGVKVGDTITIWWDVDEAYGGGRRSHTGVIDHLDGAMIHIAGSNRSPGHLRLGIASLKEQAYVVKGAVDAGASVPSSNAIDQMSPGEKAAFAEANPFVALQLGISPNPFMN